jgi:hypothetical protein
MRFRALKTEVVMRSISTRSGFRNFGFSRMNPAAGRWTFRAVARLANGIGRALAAAALTGSALATRQRALVDLNSALCPLL